MTTLLSVERAALVRGGRLLFEGLDLELGAGEATHVTGPNGSGKSSLLRLVAGLLQPSAGRIERSDAGLADDGLALDRELPLGRALAFWKGVRTGEAMAHFALDQLAAVPVELLSAGQAKRATLARVMASGAPLWLLDEPLNGLDTASLGQVEALIATHRARGGAIVAASHSALPGEWERLELDQRMEA